MAWSVAKVEPVPVPTVTLEVPAASATESGDSVNSITGAASSSVMVMVAEPMVLVPFEAVMMTVSASSSMMSCTAVTVVVTEVCPAASVSDSAPMV